LGRDLLNIRKNKRRIKEKKETSPFVRFTGIREMPVFFTKLRLRMIEEGLPILELQRELGIPVPNSSLTLTPTNHLALFENEWKEITLNSKILQAISGYKIPFVLTSPARSFLRKPSFSPIKSENCDNEIKRL